MSDQLKAKGPRGGPPRDDDPDQGPDFAARMARAEFGRHYVDPGRVEQALREGVIVLREKRPRRR